MCLWVVRSFSQFSFLVQALLGHSRFFFWGGYCSSRLSTRLSTISGQLRPLGSQSSRCDRHSPHALRPSSGMSDYQKAREHMRLRDGDECVCVAFSAWDGRAACVPQNLQAQLCCEGRQVGRVGCGRSVQCEQGRCAARDMFTVPCGYQCCLF